VSTRCWFVKCNQRFGGNCCLNLQGTIVLFRHWRLGQESPKCQYYLPVGMTSYATRISCLLTPLSEIYTIPVHNPLLCVFECYPSSYISKFLMVSFRTFYRSIHLLHLHMSCYPLRGKCFMHLMLLDYVNFNNS
jgi:hypothetical protein